MDNNIIQELRDELLLNLKRKGKVLFDDLLQSIQKITKCTLCTLWGINYPQNDTTKPSSVSLFARKTRVGISYDFPDAENYVHDYENSLIENAINIIVKEKDKPYYYSDDLQSCTFHKAKKCVEALNLYSCCIIPVNDVNNKLMAVVDISFSNKNNILSNDNQILNDFAQTICDYTAAFLDRLALLDKESLIEELMKHQQKPDHSENKEIFFKGIIENIIPKFCNCEGISFFAWDSYSNHYGLVASTIEILDENDNVVKDLSSIYYQNGKGLTGKAAADKKVLYYNDLDRKKHKGIWRTNVKTSLKTMMLVPLLKPSSKKDVIGILRLVNKENLENKEILDNFNSTDVALLQYAANYLALSLEHYLSEEAQGQFIAKLSHEFKTPASAIRKTAHRASIKKDDPIFMSTQFEGYMDDIIDLTDLQLWQVQTNHYLTKRDKKRVYTIGNYSLKTIVNNSIKIVRPIARDYDVKFINIDNNIDSLINVKIDEKALMTICYNLLTNAIKYHNRNKSLFHIVISAHHDKEYLYVSFEDNGLGLEKDEVDYIFQLGYRGNSILKSNNNGFGVGLTVVKQIIEDFGGTISVKSLKSPTIFEIRLPKDRFNVINILNKQ